MPQSLSRLLVHEIFSTKNRQRDLHPEVQPELFAYLGGALKNQGCFPIRIGGVEDHVHLFFVLDRIHSISKITEQIKITSSRWLKEQKPQLGGFAWQRGYGAFSVSPSCEETVVQYIHNQRVHHQTLTFQDEFRQFLVRHSIPFDERYVWD